MIMYIYLIKIWEDVLHVEEKNYVSFEVTFNKLCRKTGGKSYNGKLC